MNNHNNSCGCSTLLVIAFIIFIIFDWRDWLPTFIVLFLPCIISAIVVFIINKTSANRQDNQESITNNIENPPNNTPYFKNKNHLMLDEFCRICKKCVEAKYNTVAILVNNKLTASIYGQDTTIVCVCDKDIIDMDIVSEIYRSNPNNMNIMIISTGFFTKKAHEVAISLKSVELCDRNALLIMMKKANISERSI